jgi:hypothetical protein|tara:strand:+ start:930 stop:1265 length:336 start_codon:yes stop_codon:yes gene_type:complete
MTIRYKSTSFDLNTTALTTVLSISTSATAIVKTVQAVHDTASNINTDLYIKKAGGTDTIIGHVALNKAMTDMIVNTLNLEAGDTIKMQADTSNAISGVVSYALLDRSQENG